MPATRLRMSAIAFEQSVTREMRPASSSTSIDPGAPEVALASTLMPRPLSAARVVGDRDGLSWAR